ncbi:gliding motility-associated C-terminal domain-containing protein [Dyadobacter sp. CY323]|uniref:gliding motility-associated C-terminal domain-containing protein n=1 Tax=Dyadobacter sp. CY323 TaxID=2907302 RepID=UPI001F288C6F|nr:gliding motility-associated C-terminal domain-containing protein [Dyadobacter sp. CY323]
MSSGLMRILIFLMVLVSFAPLAKGNHIVGGELQMRPNGTTNTFEITLLQFWDTNSLIETTPAQFGNRDVIAELFIYQKNNNRLLTRVRVSYLRAETLAYQNKACASSRSLNTSVGIYKGIVTLNPQTYSDPEGYYIVWERCCRNDDINNIVRSGDNGMVFYLEFPPLTTKNSSPEFVAPNGRYICSNKPFTMTMGATDADGDELRYSLVTPLRGNTNTQQPFGNDSPKNGYPQITWESGISLSNVIPGSAPLKVSNKGLVTVTANTLGLYVFTVQCEEFRDGKRIGFVRRDFQLLVIDCNDDQPEPPVITYAAQPISDVAFCAESTIKLETESSSDWSYQWQLNGLNLPGETGASIMVKDSGQYSVVKSYTRKCSRDTSSLSVHVRLSEPILTTITADSDSLCNGRTMMLFANDGNVQSGQSLVWMRDKMLIPDKNTSIAISRPGVYTLEISDDRPGCIGRDTITIASEDFKLSLPTRKGVIEGLSTTLAPSLVPPNKNYTYAWAPMDGLDSDPEAKQAIVSPLQETTYTLSVTSPNGCSAQASVLVFVVDKMHIPNSFTPNNDGHNDTFQIYNAKDQILEMRVYSRWGELIFFSKGYDRPWDGTYKNEPVPAGLYPFVIKTSELDLNGFVNLIK